MKLLKYGVTSLILCGGVVNVHAYSGPEITFEHILENPSDKTLNMNYAKQQEKRGDIVTALAAVERLLFDSAGDDSLRLYYVSLLLKVDDLQAARRELTLLAGRELGGRDQSNYQKYRRESGIGQASQDTGSPKLRGMVAMGVRYDDNAGESLADGATAITTSSSDVAAFVQGALGFKMPFQNGSSSVLRGGINGQTLRHETFSGVDYDTFGAHLGLSGGSSAFTWHLDGVFQRVNVDNQEYLSEFGPTVKLATNLSPQTKLIATGRYVDQDFDDLRSTVGENGRSGDKLSGSIGIRHKVSSQTVLGVAAGYADKDASTAIYAYDGLYGNAQIQHSFDSKAYFRGAASYQEISYKGGSTRNDDRISGSATLGAPISVISDAMGNTATPFFENVNLEGTVRYTERDSNLVGLDFDSFGVEARLVWNF